ncbi:hypothetical protein [Streptomyces sp. NPDC046821]|uniref:hypothetical protein n=1 Tax=Streptomyces sp. NPDC046821 TaxID=3154702 RepID=UPI0033FC8707
MLTQNPSCAPPERTLTRVPLHAYVHPGHPWARDTGVTLDELTEQPLLLPGL